jgi:hypothetical protein
MCFNSYSAACGLEYSVYTISVMQDRSTNICDIENQRSMLCFGYKYIDSRYTVGIYNVFDFWRVHGSG